MKTYDEQNYSGVVLAISMLLALLLLMLAVAAQADEVLNDDVCIKCVMGEARGEGYQGMVAVSEALRNRGTIRGVYGCHAVFNEPKWVWDLARKAWSESAHSNLVNGADHWGSTKVDGKWIAKMEKTMTFTAQVNNHRFYKRKELARAK